MKIVFLDHHTLNADGLSLDALSVLGEVKAYPRTDGSTLMDRCKGAEVLISNKVILERDTLVKLPQLKLIVIAATGYNNVDIETCKEIGIKVCNVREYSTESVAQHTMALILRLVNKIQYYAEEVNNGRWHASQDFSFYDHSIFELKGKTIGIVGYGTIGQRVARIASAFGMNVLAFRRSPFVKDSFSTYADLPEVFKESDIISLHAPLNADSKELINKQTLALMKPSALLINTARGGLINELDLAAALNSGAIAGAALDTLNVEPPIDSPLIGLPNCVVTPHIAWASINSRKNLLDGIIQNIIAFQDNAPINVIV